MACSLSLFRSDRVVEELLSPKQVARAIGVSESSLKRWCDQGLIQTVRTAGGHRRLPIRDVIRFLRERKHSIVCPEVLGMPTRSPQSEIGLERGRISLAEALLEGNEAVARQIIFDLYLAKHSISVICDQVISRAFVEIGIRCDSQSANFYQARRSCEILLRTLYELRRAQPDPDLAWNACGGTLTGDTCTLSTMIVELILRDGGWDAISLGVSIPAASMVQAILDTKPKLFWVSVTKIEDPKRFVRDFKQLADAAESTCTVLVVFGRALTEELRRQITFCCYCDTMQQLESFAKTVRRFASALM